MSPPSTRPAAVAGSFYPADPVALAEAVDRYVADGEDGTPVPENPPPAVIVPHAGYVYSGPVAGSVYARLRTYRDQLRCVVLLGPAHRAFVEGLATVGVDALATPLGSLTVDDRLRAVALANHAVRIDDAAHALEHCLEVHLPFLQRVLGNVTVLPLLAGRVDPAVVAQVIEPVWGKPGTLIVISTDLSHYHDLDMAHLLDSRTAAAIVAGHVDAVTHDGACGATPVRAALIIAAQRGQRAQLIDLATSADTVGPPDRVVGYGAFEIR